MKIALVGYGNVGKSIEELSENQNTQIVSRIHPQAKDRVNQTISHESLNGAKIAIEFTRPDAALDNIKTLAGLGCDVVIGTTGWYEHLDLVVKIVEEKSIGLLYAPNFSIGMVLFQNLALQASKYLGSASEACFALTDRHHAGKLDSPSGTAKAVASQMEPHLKGDLKMTSIREGTEAGHHSLEIDLPFEVLKLSHQVHSRLSYAQGALQAAHWLSGRKGVFTISHMLEGIPHD